MVREPDPQAVIALPAVAAPVTLPRAQVRTTEASALATRWVMRATFVLLLVLVGLVVVGLHIPAGE